MVADWNHFHPPGILVKHADNMETHTQGNT
jgi:hypothetical protein